MYKSILFVFLAILPVFISKAEKPINQWGREDVLTYFNSNNIRYEGEYHKNSSNDWIMIGKLQNNDQQATLNFYIVDGRFSRALITTSETGLFATLEKSLEERGFQKISESNDRIGNLYHKFESENLEVTIVNKRADWPEMYFQP